MFNEIDAIIELFIIGISHIRILNWIDNMELPILALVSSMSPPLIWIQARSRSGLFFTCPLAMLRAADASQKRCRNMFSEP
jgi:hypothetical protein